ncbi:MAG: RICIN domain-containing protein [Frankiaceae bacterium]
MANVIRLRHRAKELSMLMQKCRWRACYSLLGALLTLGFIGISTSQASATTVGGADMYTLTAKHSQKCLDVAWFSVAENGDVVQSHCAGTANQMWAGYWSQNDQNMLLVAAHSGKYLDVKNDSLAHGADVVQRTGDWSYSQIWQRKYIQTVNGIDYFELVNKNSGKCLDVAWFDLSDGAKVLQANCTGTDNQLWDLYNITQGRHGW